VSGSKRWRNEAKADAGTIVIDLKVLEDYDCSWISSIRR
jgi:hypothetical protein